MKKSTWILLGTGALALYLLSKRKGGLLGGLGDNPAPVGTQCPDGYVYQRNPSLGPNQPGFCTSQLAIDQLIHNQSLLTSLCGQANGSLSSQPTSGGAPVLACAVSGGQKFSDPAALQTYVNTQVEMPPLPPVPPIPPTPMPNQCPQGQVFFGYGGMAPSCMSLADKAAIDAKNAQANANYNSCRGKGGLCNDAGMVGGINDCPVCVVQCKGYDSKTGQPVSSSDFRIASVIQSDPKCANTSNPQVQRILGCLQKGGKLSNSASFSSATDCMMPDGKVYNMQTGTRMDWMEGHPEAYSTKLPWDSPQVLKDAAAKIRVGTSSITPNNPNAPTNAKCPPGYTVQMSQTNPPVVQCVPQRKFAPNAQPSSVLIQLGSACRDKMTRDVRQKINAALGSTNLTTKAQGLKACQGAGGIVRKQTDAKTGAVLLRCTCPVTPTSQPTLLTQTAQSATTTSMQKITPSTITPSMVY